MQIQSKEDQNIIFEIQRMENEIKYAKLVLHFPGKFHISLQNAHTLFFFASS